MIIDKLENWDRYPFGPTWEKVFGFLLSLTPDQAEKRYELQGDEIFAQISRYETRAVDAARLETHQEYIDIQTVLFGNEIIATASQEGLIVKSPYDREKDITFYENPPRMDSIQMQPGMFALFFTHDAHMPGLMVGSNTELVKKVVVKIKVELLQ